MLVFRKIKKKKRLGQRHLKYSGIMLPIRENKQRQGRVVSEEEKKARSERMKKFWDQKRRKNLKRQISSGYSEDFV